MRKIYTKLVLSLLSIVVASVMIVAVSFAWTTLSTSPVASGIQISIGGGNTILLAPDVTEKLEGGTVIHYPGKFSSTLNFSECDGYEYLTQLKGLIPVSTADGIHWLLPDYDADTGRLKGFQMDDRLAFANQTEGTEEGAKAGHYVYLDFWIMSPSAEYQVRVAADTQSQTGSFLIELPTAGADGEKLSFSSGYTAATARVGFLTNTEVVQQDDKTAHDMVSSGYDALRGTYQEPGEAAEYGDDTSFLIYEPNATSHPGDDDAEGTYIVTNPLIYREESGTVAETSIQDHLTVQKSSDWLMFGEERVITQMFSSESGKNEESGKSDLTVEEFLKEQAGVGRFVTAGSFFSSTSALYKSLDANGIAQADQLEQLRTAGATDDAILTGLTRNTPQRVRMYVWLEGQDADCTNGVSLEASPFALSIELSGATK